MSTIKFTKMQGAGNDFIVIERGLRSQASSSTLVRKICDRKFGVGGDGVLFLGPSKKADVRMRIFNADGSEAEMCGNGARCAAAYWASRHRKVRLVLETAVGLHRAEVRGENVKLDMSEPTDLRLGMKVNVAGVVHDIDFIDTGVPHAVIEVEDIGKAPVRELGRALRIHRDFAPAGTNVDFFERKGSGSIAVRTYERGVEDETLACGTGSVASAIVSALSCSQSGRVPASAQRRVHVRTRGGDVLVVTFSVKTHKITDVALQGRAQEVFEGEAYEL